MFFFAFAGEKHIAVREYVENKNRRQIIRRISPLLHWVKLPMEFYNYESSTKYTQHFARENTRDYRAF